MSKSNKKYYRHSSHKKKQIQKQDLPLVTFLIVSDEEGAISIPYQIWTDPIKSLVRSKGAKWCPIFKIWKLGRVEMEYLMNELPKILTANYQYPPKFVKNATNEEQVFEDSNKRYRQDQIQSHPLYDKLYQFQKETLNFCFKRNGRILIADQMGIGKSLQSLACTCMYKQDYPVLIVCPSALKYVWKDQVIKWLGNIIHATQIFIIKKGSIKASDLNHMRVIIVSYEIAAKITSQLQYIPTVICDEAHYLKNPDTNRCQKLIPFLTKKKRVFLLTGTPALAKPRQLFNLLNILRPDIFKNLSDFGLRFCKKRHNPWSHKMQYDGAKNLSELHYLLKKTVMIRRLKEDVLSDLPAKQRQIIFMQTQPSIVNEIKQNMSTFSIQNLRKSDRIVQLFVNKSNQGESASLMKCYMLSGLAKLHSIKEYISSILQNDIKIIIFAHHKVVMDSIQDHLKHLKIQYIRLDGDSSAQIRKKKVDQFQQESHIKVALLSITAMGTGFTLTAASTVIFAQLHWTPAMLMQAEDRSHRIGQKNAVNIHYLIGDKTLDPLMLRQLQRKIETVGKVLNGQNESLHMQILPLGEVGKIQINSQQCLVQKSTMKITDYFTPYKSNKNVSFGNDKPKAGPEGEYKSMKKQKQKKVESNISYGQSDSEDQIKIAEYFLTRKKNHII